jgi:pyrroline-5-carboxylate reductase
MTLPEAKLGIIGTGNMGSAIIRGVLQAGLFAPNEIAACDVIPEKMAELAKELSLTIKPSASQTAKASQIVLIAVKPQTMEQCLGELKNAVTPDHLVLSIAAGISTSYIEKRLIEGARVIRIMPNTPALVGAGATAISAGMHASEADMAQAERIFAGIGKVYRFPETLMDAVTAVSGSGPAYLFYFAECLTGAAVQSGLPQDSAADLVAQTLFGAAKLLRESGEKAETLRAKVTSPGGTTEAALKVMHAGSFHEIIAAAVQSAVKRGQELGGVKKN